MKYLETPRKHSSFAFWTAWFALQNALFQVPLC